MRIAAGDPFLDNFALGVRPVCISVALPTLMLNKQGLLGEGTYGEVRIARDRRTQELVAVKTAKRHPGDFEGDLEDLVQANLVKEAAVMQLALGHVSSPLP